MLQSEAVRQISVVIMVLNLSHTSWSSGVVMRNLGNGSIYYEDAITIYGRIMIGFITSFAKRFYKHRQQRWQVVAEKNLKFGE